MADSTAQVNWSLFGPLGDGYNIRMRIDLRQWTKLADDTRRRGAALAEMRVPLAHRIGQACVLQVQEYLATTVHAGNTLPINYTGALSSSITYRVTPAGQNVEIIATAPHAAIVDQIGLRPGMLPEITESGAFAAVQRSMGVMAGQSYTRNVVGLSTLALNLIQWSRGKIGVANARGVYAILRKINNSGWAPRNFSSRALNDPAFSAMLTDLIRYGFQNMHRSMGGF